MHRINVEKFGFIPLMSRHLSLTSDQLFSPEAELTHCPTELLSLWKPRKMKKTAQLFKYKKRRVLTVHTDIVRCTIVPLPPSVPYDSVTDMVMYCSPDQFSSFSFILIMSPSRASSYLCSVVAAAPRSAVLRLSEDKLDGGANVLCLFLLILAFAVSLVNV